MSAILLIKLYAIHQRQEFRAPTSFFSLHLEFLSYGSSTNIKSLKYENKAVKLNSLVIYYSLYT